MGPLHYNTIAPHTLEILRTLMSDEYLSGHLLVGGTALSLMIGHRKSIDLDLFAQDVIDREDLERHLRNGYHFITDHSMGNSLLGHIDNIKIDLISYPYKLVAPPEDIDGIRLISVQDIAAMKLCAIMNSGKRVKDFVDIAYLSTQFSFRDITRFFSKKYPDSSMLSAVKSLVYFDDIDYSARVDMVSARFNWTLIKRRLETMVARPNEIFNTPPLEPHIIR